MDEKNKKTQNSTKKIPAKNKEIIVHKNKRMPLWALLLVILSAVTAVTCAIVIPLTCRAHTFSQAYTYDEDNHWHECTDCEDIKDRAPHTYDNDCDTTCNDCGATRTTTHIYECVADNENHWQECSVCHDIKAESIDTHTFLVDSATGIAEGKCPICGFVKETQGLIYNFVPATAESEAYYEVTSLDTATNVKHIKIPATHKNEEDNIDYPVKSVGESAFAVEGAAQNIISVTFLENMETIGAYAFGNCTNLSSVTFSNTITKIGDCAFIYCTSITNMTFSNGLKEIGLMAFYKSGLTSINIPASVETIGNINPFASCENLTTITVDSGNTKFHTTNNCLIDTINKKIVTGLNLSNIPTDRAEVTTIGNSAFYGCSGVRNLKIPSNITTLEECAFESCSSFTSVEIPVELTVEQDAFKSCSALSIVYYHGVQIEDWNRVTINNSGNTKLKFATIYYLVENENEVPTDDGNYWHDVNGVPTPW